MNRIRDIRLAQDLTLEALAIKVGTTAATISRLERGKLELTLEWMRDIAQALQVRPEDLIASAALARKENDVEPYVSIDPAVKNLSAAGILLFRVINSPLTKLGIRGGDILTFNTGPKAPKPTSGDVVLVRILGDYLVIRQFVWPDLLTTNKAGTNVAISMDDPAFGASIEGVLAPGSLQNYPQA